MSKQANEKATILKLSAAKHGEPNPAQLLTYVFGPKGGTIGRKDCVWTLEDTKGVLSRKHVEIAYRNDHYVIIDHSTNGTFINGSSHKLGPGMEHRIVDGDQIEIGEYLLLATLEEETRESSGEAALDTTAIDSCTDHSAISEQSTHPYTEPKLGENIDLEDKGASFAKPPSWAMEEDTPGEQSNTYSQAITECSANKLDSSILAHHLSPPRSIEIDQSESQGEEAAARPLNTPPTNFIPGGAEFQGFDDPPTISSRVEQPELEIKTDRAEVNSEQQDTFKPPDQHSQTALTFDQRQKLVQSLGVSVSKEPILAVRPSKSPTADKDAEKQISSESTGHDENALFNAFLEGLGVPDWEVPEASREAYMRMMGEALQKAIQGLIQSLHLRDEFKNEFVVPGTVMRSIQNNPFKYAVNTEDALSRAFLKTASDAYLPIVEAITQSFEEIAAHHLALVAGMQAAVSGLLGLFSPSELEKRMSSLSLMDRVMPQLKHARLWEAYLREYQTIAVKAEEDFQDLLGRKFAKAYNDQVMALNLAEFGKTDRET